MFEIIASRQSSYSVICIISYSTSFLPHANWHNLGFETSIVQKYHPLPYHMDQMKYYYNCIPFFTITFISKQSKNIRIMYCNILAVQSPNELRYMQYRIILDFLNDVQSFLFILKFIPMYKYSDIFINTRTKCWRTSSWNP